MILIRRLLGDVLRRKRQDEGRTLRQLAAAARISPGYLSEIERGQKEPSSELLAAICDALEARLSDVLREVSIELAAAELAAQLESERISASVPNRAVPTARVGAGNQAGVKSMPLAKPVPRGAVRPGARPAARPVTRRVPPATVGAVAGTQNLAVGPVPTPGLAPAAPGLAMSPVPGSPLPTSNLAAGPVGASHLAMGSPNLLAYPVVLPGAGANPMPQLALR
jgi:transcriptional regulator with XRE-family HTH domain